MTILTKNVFTIAIFIFCITQQGFGFDEEFEYNYQDLTELCLNKLLVTKYLTFDMGQSDAIVFIITEHVYESDCSINILAGTGNSIIMVFEFPGDTHGNSSEIYSDLTNVLTVSDLNERTSYHLSEMQRVAAKETSVSEPILSFVMSNKVKIRVKSGKVKFDSVKITATSARYTNTTCNADYQVHCFFDDRKFCLTADVVCDGNLNCATPGQYDEDFRVCYKDHLTNFLPLICTIILLIVIVIFVIYQLVKAQTQKSTRAYFVFDETDNQYKLHSRTFGSNKAQHHSRHNILDVALRVQYTKVIETETERQVTNYEQGTSK